jgi:glucokinase-like ROK family protein
MMTTKAKGSSQLINKLNKIRVLNIIREHSQISRADISKLSGISAPTITRIVSNLIEDEKLVSEVGIGASSGGRKPTLIEFSADNNFVIGVDIGKTHIDGVLSDLNANTVTEIRIRTKIEEGYESIISRTSDIICELKNDKKVKNRKIFGVGLAVAGLVNKIKNKVELSPNFHWKDVDIKQDIFNKCHLPVKFDNVSRVMALGELMYGVGNQVNNFIVINVGYGIGAGIIIDRKPLYGPYGMAGELGHITVDKNSKVKCECGNNGCLEALASGNAIAKMAIKAAKKNKRSLLYKLSDGNIDNVTAELVAEAVRKGDKIAVSIWNEAIDHIGTTIAGMINLLSPELVFVGGGVAQSEDLIFDRISKIVEKRAMITSTRKVSIRPVTFGMNSATKGAVALILGEVLKLNFSEN